MPASNMTLGLPWKGSIMQQADSKSACPDMPLCSNGRLPCEGVWQWAESASYRPFTPGLGEVELEEHPELIIQFIPLGKRTIICCS